MGDANFLDSCISGMGGSDSFELITIKAVNNSMWKNENKNAYSSPRLLYSEAWSKWHCGLHFDFIL